MNEAKAALVLFAAVGAALAAKSAQNSDGGPSKRALIVSIGEYAPETGWWEISAENDAPLIERALRRHGFSSIEVIRNAQATKTGILTAIRRHLGVAKRGDVVALHFSSHGQQLPDDDGDELDGYDEAVVPYDAPLKHPPGYKGEKHLRDDDLQRELLRLRRNLGPEGNVIVFLDACFSGTGTRGNLRVRGACPDGSKGDCTHLVGRPSEGSGFLDAGSAVGAAGSRGGGQNAPFVVFSASRHDAVAQETWTEENKPVGSLSYAISRALLRAGPQTTYRAVFEEVERAMFKKRIPNEPQIEGNVDTRLFNGQAVAQEAFFEVAKVFESGAKLSLSGGSLLGLTEGSEVELHESGALSPEPKTLIAKGTVALSSPLEAFVDLSEPVDEERLMRSRVFLTRPSFGHLRIKVQLVGFEAADQEEKRLASLIGNDVPAAELVSAGPDLVIRKGGDRNVVMETSAEGARVFGPLSLDDEDFWDRIANRVRDYAYNRYLRGIELRNEALRVQVEVIPVALSNCLAESRPDTCKESELPLARFRGPGNQLALPIGAWFRLRVNRDAGKAVHLAILELQEDGRITLLWPAEPTDRTKFHPGAPLKLPAYYQIEGPPGRSGLMVISSEGWIDFSPLATALSLRGRGAADRSGLGPFAPLFDDTGIRARSRPVYRPGAIHTEFVHFSIIEKPGSMK